jgi:signal peptidase II
MNFRLLSRILLITLAVIIVDQVTKIWILATFQFGEISPVIPQVFNLTLVFNKGAAFGIFSGIESPLVRGLVLGISTSVALAIVVIALFKEYKDDVVAQCAIALILGGAVGNIIDRARLGMVVDFLDFYISSHHWPAFNIADSAICIGVTVLILLQVMKAPKKNELVESTTL